MSNITQVTLTSGIPSGPSGAATVSTLDALMADGGQATIGSKADAAVSNPASSGSTVALLKGLLTLLAGTLTVATHAVTQSGSWVLSAGSAIIGKVGIDQTTDGTTNAVRLLAETTKAIGVTRTADGSGNLVTSTGGALDVNLKTPVGRKSTATSNPVADSGLKYQAVAASASATALSGGGGGAVGDYLAGLVCVVSTAATSQVQITDGSGSAITVLPNAVGPGVGTYPVPLGLFSTSGAWKITTAAGVSVLAMGDFT